MAAAASTIGASKAWRAARKSGGIRRRRNGEMASVAARHGGGAQRKLTSRKHENGISIGMAANKSKKKLAQYRRRHRKRPAWRRRGIFSVGSSRQRRQWRRGSNGVGVAVKRMRAAAKIGIGEMAKTTAASAAAKYGVHRWRNSAGDGWRRRAAAKINGEMADDGRRTAALAPGVSAMAKNRK